jgi:hypothetical protein
MMGLKMNLHKLAAAAFMSLSFWSMGYGAWDGVIRRKMHTGGLEHCAFCYPKHGVLG